MLFSLKKVTISETLKEPYNSPFSLAAISFENFNSLIFNAVLFALDLFSSSFLKDFPLKILFLQYFV